MKSNETDDDIIKSIVEKPNNWSPSWHKETPNSVCAFVVELMENDYEKRQDKTHFLN